MVPSYYPKPPQIRVRDDDADHDDDDDDDKKDGNMEEDQ